MAERGEFLLEIGCEEIPAGWLPGVTRELRERFLELSEREHLLPSEPVACSTPRRLILKAEVAARQADREEPVWGPALKLARDAAGGWTKAAEGFARKYGVTPAELQVGAKDPAKPAEQNLLFVRRVPGRAAAEVLAGLIAPLLRGLSFPKRMTWDAWLEDGKGAFPFGRPIRWLVALFDRAVVPFTVYANERGARGGVLVQAGDRTRGHRFLPRERPGASPRVSSFAELVAALEQHAVIAFREARAALIQEQLEKGLTERGLERKGASYLADRVWPDLVEQPTVVIGGVPTSFLQLPLDVVATVLVHHQGYMPLGRIREGVTGFAAITNIDAGAAPAIVRGMERVVVARLRDAVFFYQEDRKRPLGDRIDDLAGVMFHQKLGSYREKAHRLVRLIDTLSADRVLSNQERDVASRAALLAKADLTTLMVREFPELQGTVGGIYLHNEARASQGESSLLGRVSEAVRWHYHPVTSDSRLDPSDLPRGGESRAGWAVALVDKLDTLAGHFLIGSNPTGSSDPFGLRRAAQGVVRILLEFWEPSGRGRPNLERMIEAACSGYPSQSADTRRAKAALSLFLLDRLSTLLESQGYPADEVRAVMYSDARDVPSPLSGATGSIQALEDPHDVRVRLLALHSVRAEAPQDFADLAAAFKRASNILQERTSTLQPVDPSLFDSPAERELHTAVGERARIGGSYETRLRELAALRAPVDRFFDDVLVMAEDPRVRANRLGLLQETLSLFYRIADISRLGG